jgi:beta-N-acetylhexosaminidase
MALGVVNDPEALYAVGQAVGKEMLSLGVNMNFAPVLDVNNNPANPVINLRSYSNSPDIVTALGQQFILGQQSVGVIAVAKHFPGHGGVAVDSHYALPQLDVPLESLRQIELHPFDVAIRSGVRAIMVGHIQVSALDPVGWPATLSPSIITGLLRGELAFPGVIMTDDMGMGAIINDHSLEMATVQAVLAGNDLLLSVETENYPEIMQSALLNAVANGQISETRIDESVRRLIRLKLAFSLSALPPTPILPNRQSHQQLAQQLGVKAVHVKQDLKKWLPFESQLKHLLLVSPSLFNPGSVIGDNKSLLNEELQKCGITVSELFYQPDLPRDIVQVQSRALTLAPTVDAVVVVTWDASLRYDQYGETAQENLVNELLDISLPVVVVFGRSPYDENRLANVPTSIVTYGDTSGQIVGTVSLLLQNCYE